MSSAFLPPRARQGFGELSRAAILEQTGRNAGFKVECNARDFSIQNLMTVKKRSGLSFEKRINRVPAGKASPKATGRIMSFCD